MGERHMKTIFVGGVERSGTTMLGSMLGTPATYICPPEMPFKTTILDSDQDRWSPMQLRELVLSDPKTELQGWRIAEQDWRFENASSSQAVVEIVRGYARLVDRADPAVWIDHTPNNARRALTLMRAFPDARFIHVVRDGRAVAASLRKLEWGPNTMRRAARFWLEGLSFGLAAESAFADRSIRVRYEDVVADPIATLREICEEVGIAFDPLMREGRGLQVAAYTRGQHALVGKPPQAERVTRWRNELADREVEIFEAEVGDALQLLGYEPQFGPRAKAATKVERLKAEANDLVRRRVINRARKRARFRAGRST